MLYVGMDTAIGHSLARAMVRGKGNLTEVRNPEGCALALEMLANGETYAAIEGATGISRNTLVSLRYRHSDAIEVRRERAADDAEHMAERYRAILEQRAEQLEGDGEALARVNPKDLALTYGILRDKASTLRGDASSVVEHKKGLSLEDARRMIEEAQKRVRDEAIEVESVDGE